MATRDEMRKSLNEDAVLAWEEYERTGLHLTLEEVSVWLSTWGSPDESPPPTCHE